MWVDQSGDWVPQSGEPKRLHRVWSSDGVGQTKPPMPRFGRSLGSGPAVFLAAQYPVGGHRALIANCTGPFRPAETAVLIQGMGVWMGSAYSIQSAVWAGPR